ncbi:hypothetical protein HDU84_002636 [Entophlyctis sp. JEL0112]|nr:hypothetical protein HDU84_002636 [Entophlyctis sp. JEL0112]
MLCAANTAVTVSVRLNGGDEYDAIDVSINELTVTELRMQIQAAFDLPNTEFDVLYCTRKDGFVPHKLKPTPNSKLRTLLKANPDPDDILFEVKMHPHKIKVVFDGSTQPALVLELDMLEVEVLRSEIDRCFPDLGDGYMIQYSSKDSRAVLRSDSALEALYDCELPSKTCPTIYVVQPAAPIVPTAALQQHVVRSTRKSDVLLETSFDIMLSYSWSTKSQVLELYNELRNRYDGIKIWVDDAEMDKDVYLSMVEGVVKSDLMIVCLSKPYLTSANCMREIKFAADLKKPLIPARMFEETENMSNFLQDPELAVPFLITSGLLYIDFKMSHPPSAEWNSAVDSICRQIESRLPKFARTQSDSAQDTPPKVSLSVWLQPVDFAADVDNYASEYVAGTREWLADVFDEWRLTNESVMWLNGGAGTGKSIISFKVACDPPARYRLGSLFFCRHNDEQKNDVRYIVATIAWDLSCKFKSVRDHMEKIMAEDLRLVKEGKASVLFSPIEAFEELVVDGLHALKNSNELSQTGDTILLVIDALDECDPKTRNQLLHILTQSCKNLPEFAKVFTTGRPDLDIFESLSGIDPFVLKPTSDRNVSDIKKFISVKLSALWNVSVAAIEQNETMASCVEALLKKSEGVFIYARNACEFLQKDQSKTPQIMLDQIHKFNRGPDSMYSMILEREFGVTDPSELLVFKHVFGIILAVREPVPINILAKVGKVTASEAGLVVAKVSFAFKCPDLSDLSKQLRSILKIEQNNISVIHKSLKDYLTDVQRCGTKFFINVPAMNEEICEVCLCLMVNKLSHNLLNLNSGDEYHPTVSMISSIPKEIAYACQFWVEHFLESRNKEAFVPLLHTLCKEKIINFLELVLILQKLNLFVHSCSRLIATLQMLPKSDETMLITEIINDLHRAAINFRPALLFNPLQAYKTVLVWAPQNSALYTLYTDATYPKVVIGASKAWGPLNFEGHMGGVLSVAFSPDGRWIASSGKDSVVKMWTAATGECRATFRGHTNWVNCVDFSRNGSVIVSASSDKTLKAWHAETGDCLHTFVGHKWYVTSCSISPDGTRVASGSLDSSVKLWSLQTGECLHTYKGHTDWVMWLKISPDSTFIASCGKDLAIRTWDIASGEELATLSDSDSLLRCIDISFDGKLAASGDNERFVKIWDLGKRECVKVLKGHLYRIYSVAFNADAKMLASAGIDKTVCIWDLETFTCLATLEGHSNWVMSVAFSPAGTFCASASNDMTIKLWPVGDKAQLAKSKQNKNIHTNDVTCIFLSEDESLIASASTDLTVRVWSTETGRCVSRLTGHKNWVNGVCIASDNRIAASGSRDKTVKIWALDADEGTAPGDCLHTLKGHSDFVKTVAFSPDNTIVASGANDATLRLWLVNTGDCIREFRGHTSLVSVITFSWDQKMVASAGRDCWMFLWELESGALLRKFETDVKYPESIEFRNNQTVLAVVYSEGTTNGWMNVKKSSLQRKALSITTGEAVNIQEEKDAPYASGEWIFKNGNRVCWIPDSATKVANHKGAILGISRGNMVIAVRMPKC